MDHLSTTSFISFDDSEFHDKLRMSTVSIKGNLSMNGAEFRNGVVLWKADIAGQLSMKGAKFTKDTSGWHKELSMRYASIGSNLFMPGAKFKDVDLILSNVKGWFSILESEFDGRLEMESASVGGSIFMAETCFVEPVKMNYLEVGADLDARGVDFVWLDLTGARIERALRFDSWYITRKMADERTWKMMCGQTTRKNGDSNLTLLNASIGSLQDTKETWADPLELELKGFTYDHLGASGENAPIKRKSSWYIGLLERDEPFSLQPYTQLAGVLRTDGLNDMADDVLFAMRERERENLWDTYVKDAYFKGWIECSGNLMNWGSEKNCDNLRGKIKWFGLTVLRYAYGYGYGLHSFLSLTKLIGILTLIGTAALYLEPYLERCKSPVFSNFLDRMIYSLDMLLPIIHLREQNYSDVKLTSCMRFYFDFHKVAGYVIVFFLLAWLSGHAS